MKYFKRSGLYKASNVTFDPKEISAYSYDWWKFVSRIGGKIVFNDYNYSNTTRKHQWKVRHLMRELGIKIDLTAEVRKGMQEIKTIGELKRRHLETLKEIAEEQQLKRLRRNAAARARRLEIKTLKQPLSLVR